MKRHGHNLHVLTVSLTPEYTTNLYIRSDVKFRYTVAINRKLYYCNMPMISAKRRCSIMLHKMTTYGSIII